MSLHTRRCELQLSRAERAPGSWTCASATLKLGRCTKGSLEPGTAYLFRARAIGRDEVGPWGSCVEMQTILPQIPQVAVVLTPVELRHDQHSMYRGACRSILKHKLAFSLPHLSLTWRTCHGPCVRRSAARHSRCQRLRLPRRTRRPRNVPGTRCSRRARRRSACRCSSARRESASRASSRRCAEQRA